MIRIALLGFGVVGSGTAEVLTENRALLASRAGEEIDIRYILDRREFPDHPLGDRVVHDIAPILADPEIRVVAEMMGGAHPAYEFTRAALEAGKSVVTSNKEVVATFGAELLEIACAHGVSYLFEASVGGGIPIIRPLRDDLASNRILSVSGILNGTTNFILTEMGESGATFASALAEAQKRGYAEADPTADVEGLDAARKIVILAALSFGILLSPSEITVKGITRLTGEQTEVAESLGCAVKLIGHTERIGDRVLALVEPHMVSEGNPLRHVNGVYNGILVDGNMLGRAFFYGAGAGKLPTASAVVADILNAVSPAENLQLPAWRVATKADYASPALRRVRRCFVLSGCANCAEKTKPFFGYDSYIVRDGRFAFLSRPMTEAEANEALDACGKKLLWFMPVLD